MGIPSHILITLQMYTTMYTFVYLRDGGGWYTIVGETVIVNLCNLMQFDTHYTLGGDFMKCIVCGKEFEPNRSWQKYCCPQCKHYADHHSAEIKSREEDTEAPVIREFHCRKCGTLVQVRDHKDFRMRFCSLKCEKAYWKHSHKKAPENPVFHFRCEECGAPVTVSDPKDRRRRFCSAVCRCRWNSKNQLKKARAMAEEKVSKEG